MSVQQLAIPEEERTLWVHRVQRLVKMSKSKQYTKKGISDAFQEWQGIAERLRRGEEIISQNQQMIQGNVMTHPHMISLVHLYHFLIIMFNLYDGFFMEAFAQANERYERAYYKIAQIILPHHEYTGSCCALY